MNVKHGAGSKWVKQGLFSESFSFEQVESRINQLAEEKDRGDVFEIFIEGYLATQSIAQCKEHWVVGSIPLALRMRYNLPSHSYFLDYSRSLPGRTPLRVASRVRKRKISPC